MEDDYLDDEVLHGFVERKLLMVGEDWRDCGRVTPEPQRRSRTSIGSSASATESCMGMMRWMIFSSGTPSSITCPRWWLKWKDCGEENECVGRRTNDMKESLILRREAARLRDCHA